MKKTTTLKRKMGRMITKNLIILLVVVLAAALAIWAWFTQTSKATADGISVKAKSDGVEVSWDGTNYYKDLTAMRDEDVVPKETGLANNLCESLGTEETSLKLITGNGLYFFDPILNRRTGAMLKNSNGNAWLGSQVTDDNSSGKYIDVDLYFRSTDARSIYLAGDSRVTPKSTSERMSEYGNFSKDYICAASRVAFLNASKNVCNLIWAPNSDYELRSNASGFTKFVSKSTIEGEGTVGDTSDLESRITFTSPVSGSYYLWLPSDYSSDSLEQQYNNISCAGEMEFTALSNGTGLYTYEYIIEEPDRGSNPTIIFYINQSETSVSYSDFNNVVITGNSSSTTNDPNDAYPKVALSDNSYNMAGQNNYAWAFYIDRKGTQFVGETLKITIGYNPVTKQVAILKYSSLTPGGTDKTYDSTGGDQAGTEDIDYYEINNNTTLVLANATNAKAVSYSNASEGKTVTFKSSAKTNIVQSSVTQNEVFVAKKTLLDDTKPYEATYKFQLQSSATRYLVCNTSGMSFSSDSAATSFYLKYVEGVSAPVLQTTEGKCLIYRSGGFALAELSEVAESNFVTIFTGSTYELRTQSTAIQSTIQTEHIFYRQANITAQTLNSSSTPPLFATESTASESTIIGKKSSTNYVKIADLTKADDDAEYATGHIVIRIWAEGTDRDALTPLADGIFDVFLHFTSILPNS